MDIEMVVLRLLHVVLGVFWVGSVLFTFLLLQPAARDAGPAGNQVMQKLMARKLPVWMMVSAVLTILAGLRLYWRVSGGGNPLWMHSAFGRVISIGAAAAIIGFAGGMVITMPAARKLGAVLQAGDAAQRGPEIAALQRRMAAGGQFTAVLLLIAIICMAVARYA